MAILLDPVNELNHYYKDTCLSKTINNIKVPFYAKEFKKGNYENYIICEGLDAVKNNNDSFMWVPGTTPAELLNYEYPEIGYINAYNCAYYVSRAPDRQFKKGISKSSLYINKIASIIDEIAALHQTTSREEEYIEKIYYLFNTKYYSLLEIINKINKFEIYSGAINRLYAVQPTYDKEILLLMYKNNKIGYIKNEVAIISKHNIHFMESLSEYIKVEVQ